MTNVIFNTDEQKVSYGFGLQFGQQLQRNFFEGLDIDILQAGIQDILNQNNIQITDSELNQAFAAVQKKIEAKNAQQAKQLAELGKVFLTENAKREGVTTLVSGLQYEVINSGNGKKPTTNDTVKTHYHGTFVDGTVFDSSVARGEPATFGVTQVIRGWTEALQLMQVGDKWRIFLPSDLAYGDHGAPPSIPGGSTLIFEIELLDII